MMRDKLKIFIENNREGFKETSPSEVWKNIENEIKKSSTPLKTKKLSTMLKYGFGASVLIIGTIAIMNLKKENTNIASNRITDTSPAATTVMSSGVETSQPTPPSVQPSPIKTSGHDPKNQSPITVNTPTDPLKQLTTSSGKLAANTKVNLPDTLDVTVWRVVGSAIESYTFFGDYSTGKNIGVMRSVQKKISGFGGFMMSTTSDENNILSSMPEKYLGKRVRFTGYLKTENVEEWAGLWLRIGMKGGDKALGFDNMRYGKKDRSIKGTTPWTKYEVVLDVPLNASNIIYGVMIAGIGEIRWHTLVLEIVDTSVPVTAALQSSYPGILQRDRFRSYHPTDFWKWYVPRRIILKDGTSQVDYRDL
jgi:hypothetical protein